MFVRAGSFYLFVGLVHLIFGSLSEVVDAVSSVQSGSYLLVCLHKPLQLNVQVLVLVLKYIAVVHKGVDFGTKVVVASSKRLI